MMQHIFLAHLKGQRMMEMLERVGCYFMKVLILHDLQRARFSPSQQTSPRGKGATTSTRNFASST